MSTAKNVLGTELRACCMNPIAGFYRNGRCDTGRDDVGLHLVCAEMTAEFLEFSSKQGNDLSTPNRENHFPGLVPGNRWCLCIERWKEAVEAGVAPPVVLEATHMSAIEFVTVDLLQDHAVDPGE